jgi:hypothetical protein
MLPASCSRELSLPFRVFQRLHPRRITPKGPKTSRRRDSFWHPKAPRCPKAPPGPLGKRLSWGPAPSSRSNKSKPLASDAPITSDTVRPQVFSTSRRLNPRLAPRPCFMPLTRSGVYPPGASPPGQQARLVGELYPHAVAFPLPALRRAGMPSISKPDFRALLHPGVRLLRPDVTPDKGPFPSWASLLFRVLSPPAVAPLSRALRSCPWPRGSPSRGDPRLQSPWPGYSVSTSRRSGPPLSRAS